ncbi:hypothetical protein EUGRSUZ_D01705 [Eucalyptus grandis]|uniref:Uncharacterized protein n=2 Tax=Eucalyptus grandis TaxID=71139 RepID=A0ACC3L7W5_EUCGR|nr:hypothetical protein EUGRSUZ_D01705 [Eucalyptus grandis]
MSLPFKSCFLILLILLHACLGNSESIDTAKSLRSAKGEGNVAVKVRKLIGLEALLDYEPPGANPAHDPKKGGGKGP